MTWSEDSEEKAFPFLVIRKPTVPILIHAHKWADLYFENNPSLRLSWPFFFLKKPSVVAIRTWINRMDGKIAWQDKLKFWRLRSASAVIAVSNGVRDKCWPGAIVISNPYRNELFKLMPDIPRIKDFVFLGRIVSDKGADFAINALAKIITSTNDPAFFLTIIGDGPELQPLKNMVRNLGLLSNVEFRGSLKGEALVACLNEHKYILVPSKWDEPFGNVALEGMACGCIPVVSNSGGLLSAVGNAGVSFARGNLESLEDCLLNLISDSNLQKTLKAAAHSHLLAHQPDVISKKYLSVIEKAVMV